MRQRNIGILAVALIVISATPTLAQSRAHVVKHEDQAAANALFGRSDLAAATRLAQDALRTNPVDRIVDVTATAFNQPVHVTLPPASQVMTFGF